MVDLQVNSYNNSTGNEREQCDICKNKGYIAFNRDGEFTLCECKCRARAKTKGRIYRSGLSEMFDRYSLDGFKADKPWQAQIKKKAVEYIAGARGWFFICGRSGSGKTHITAAIVREMICAGMEARYFMWRHDAPMLKSMIKDWDTYSLKLRDFTDCRVLLIDDLWKGGNLTDGDLNLTYDLINSRYNSPSKLTVISTEWDLADIMRRDEAIGGRIKESAEGYVLKTQNENYRLLK